MLVSLRDVHKSYSEAAGRTAILCGVDMDLAAGETLALTGESGSGKSTLLHLIGGLDSADSGQVILDGQALSALDDAALAGLRRTTVGVVFQQFNLIPSLNVADNLAFQARLSGRHDARRIADLAQRMGLEPHLRKYPEALSGGQQQRVAIARVLATAPKLVLADEPTGNLDEASAAVVLDLLLELVGETDAALLMVTHSAQLAARMERRLNLQAGGWHDRTRPVGIDGPLAAQSAAAFHSPCRARAGHRAVVRGAGDQCRGARQLSLGRRYSWFGGSGTDHRPCRWQCVGGRLCCPAARGLARVSSA